MNKSKWDSSQQEKMSGLLGYCAQHDAFFEITLMANMEWFGQPDGRDEGVESMTFQQKEAVLRSGYCAFYSI